VQSQTKTVAEYLEGLEPERQDTIRTVRKLILEALPPGYEEAWLGA